MRGLVASDDKAFTSRIHDVLLRGGVDCAAGHLVPLELAAERASRLVPELLILVTRPDPEVAIETLREVCRTIHTHVVAIGPTDNAKLILRIMHEGADEYVDEAQIDDNLANAIIRFKTRRAAVRAELDNPGRVICILAPSGGSGSSTVAANLAAVLAKQHGSCGLVDLRLLAGDLASLLDLKPTYSVADLCEHLSRVDQRIYDQCFIRHSSGVYLLAAPREYDRVDKVTAKGIRQTLAMARGRFHYVVVDMEDAFGHQQVEALWQAEVIVLVLRLDYTSLRNTRRSIDRLNEVGLDTKRVQLIVNRYGERRQLAIHQAELALEMKISLCIPDDPARVNGAVNAGTLVVLQRPKAKFSKRIAALAAAVNGCASQEQTKRNPP